MDAMQAIRERHSVRAFLDRPLSRDQLQALVNAGRLAPTARNEQPWEFIVITTREGRAEIAGLTDHGRFIGDAAACIAVVCRDTKYYLEDGCAAVENILIAATALGLASCWVAGDKKPYAPQVLAALGVPAGHRLVALLALGYPERPPVAAARREVADVLHWERF